MTFHPSKIIIIIAMIFAIGAHAQTEIKITDPGVSINDNGNNTPDPNAVLHINSNNKGVMFPHLDSETRDAIPNPSPGLLIFNSDNCIYEYFNGSSWQVIGVIPVQGVPLAPGYLTAEMTNGSQVTLTWTDNSDNESGFEIWHSFNSPTMTLLAKVNSNETSYIHNGPSPGYHNYQIRSLNGCSSSDLSMEAGTMLLDFDIYGETYLELRTYNDNKFVINSSYPGAQTHYRQWLDASENGLNFTQDNYLKQFQLVDSDIGNSSSTFQQQIVGLPEIAASNVELIYSNKADFNFLHQGNQDYTIYHEFVAIDDKIDNLGNGPELLVSGTYQKTGLQLQHLHHPNPTVYHGRENVVRLWLWNGTSELVEILSQENSVVKGMNYIMIRYNSTDRVFEVKINDYPFVTGTAINNFNTGDSHYFFTLTNNQKYALGNTVIWKSILPESSFLEIKTLMSDYYQQH